MKRKIVGKRYLGQKVIDATPLTLGDFYKMRPGVNLGGTHTDESDGYHVIYADNYDSWSPKDVFERNHIELADGNLYLMFNRTVELTGLEKEVSQISDGYHSFDDLYRQRLYLTASLFNSHPKLSWKSKKHDDGTMFDDCFVVGINTPDGPYTYHYELKHWDLFKIQELERGVRYDGHTSDDVDRLMSINK